VAIGYQHELSKNATASVYPGFQAPQAAETALQSTFHLRICLNVASLSRFASPFRKKIFISVDFFDCSGGLGAKRQRRLLKNPAAHPARERRGAVGWAHS
jgi:hypothetical protein